MENNPAYYTDLISRYFSAELSGKELQVLSDWLKADKANKDLFREYQATWQLLAKSAIDVINLDDEWDALQHRIKPGSSDIKVPISTINEEAKIRFSGFRSFRKVAAAILV